MLNFLTLKERFTSCKNVFEKLSDIPYAVIKGAVLSQAAYGDISYRSSGDIDILTSRSNVQYVKEVLKNEGFIQGKVIDNTIVPYTRSEILYHTALSHQAAPFIKETKSQFCPFINVDVNLDIMWGEISTKTDMDYVLQNSETTNICGIQVKKLSPVMEFISLCLHHYKDMNSIYLLSMGSLKLSLLCDIYFYIKNNALSLMDLTETCKELNVAEYVYYCIYYSKEIFGDSALNAYLSALESEKAESILNTFGLKDDEIKEWNISFEERLFGENFLGTFYNLVGKKDLEKIKINASIM